MSQYRNILLLADPELRSTTALRRAAYLAQLTGARLRIAMFCYDSAIAATEVLQPHVMELAKKAYLADRKEWLARQKEELKPLAGNVLTEITWGAPVHERIVRRVLEERPDLVIKDAVRETGLQRLLFTPLDWNLLRLCPAPLLLVNPIAHRVPERIVAAVDPSNPGRAAGALNDRVVQAALDLARQTAASLRLVHAFQPFMPAIREGFGTPDQTAAYEELRAQRRACFEEFAGACSVPADRRHFLDGPAAMAITDFAVERQADVIVLGTIHRTGIDRLIMGSTAESILQRVRSDVLAVKPEGFDEDLRRYLQLNQKAADRDTTVRSGRSRATA